MWICENCGKTNTAGSECCEYCGWKPDAIPEDEHAALSGISGTQAAGSSSSAGEEAPESGAVKGFSVAPVASAVLIIALILPLLFVTGIYFNIVKEGLQIIGPLPAAVSAVIAVIAGAVMFTHKPSKNIRLILIVAVIIELIAAIFLHLAIYLIAVADYSEISEDYFKELTGKTGSDNAAPASAAGTSSCGPDCTWSFDDNGVLRISGTGKMYDYEIQNRGLNTPWADLQIEVKEVIVEDGITEIGDYCFYYLECLKRVTLPEGITRIGDCAFCATGIREISIPDSVTSIGRYAFYKCMYLEEIRIPDRVETIGYGAFVMCISLRSVYIGDSASFIGAMAFEECRSLKSIFIPGSVIRFEGKAFDQTPLETVYYEGSSEEWEKLSVSEYGVSLIPEGVTVHCNSQREVPAAPSPDITAEQNTSSVPEQPAAESLAAVIASGECGPDCRWTLDETGLLRISGSGRINDYATPGYGTPSPWNDCINDIKDIVIEKGITEIGDSAFEYINVEKVTLPYGVTRIGRSAFFHSGISEISIPDSVKTIGANAFLYCENLEEITIPDSVTIIGSGAFDSCTSLRSAHIGDSVIYIGGWTFNQCTSLKSIFIPKSLLYSEASAFRETMLESVYYAGSKEDLQKIHPLSNSRTPMSFPKGVTVYYNAERP